MSIIIRSGTYVKYRNRLYKKSTKDTAKGMVKILSGDKSDLKNGFICDYSQEFIEKYWFCCEKDVPKSEITEAYEIRTHAVYKGVGASIIGCLKKNWIGLRTTCLYGEDENEFLKKVNNAGFKYIEREQGGVDVYGIDVSLDDPDLKLEEIRKELDISKLKKQSRP